MQTFFYFFKKHFYASFFCFEHVGIKSNKMRCGLFFHSLKSIFKERHLCCHHQYWFAITTRVRSSPCLHLITGFSWNPHYHLYLDLSVSQDLGGFLPQDILFIPLLTSKKHPPWVFFPKVTAVISGTHSRDNSHVTWPFFHPSKGHFKHRDSRSGARDQPLIC